MQSSRKRHSKRKQKTLTKDIVIYFTKQFWKVIMNLYQHDYKIYFIILIIRRVGKSCNDTSFIYPKRPVSV